MHPSVPPADGLVRGTCCPAWPKGTQWSERSPDRLALAWSLAFGLLTFSACASAGIQHGSDRPLNWSVTVGDELVCETGKGPSCVLTRSTAERPVFATFSVHVQSPVPWHFKGTLTVGFFADNPPRTEAPIDLFSSGADVHASLTGQLTTQPGAYTASVRVEETGDNLPSPIRHSFTVPVTVRDGAPSLP